VKKYLIAVLTLLSIVALASNTASYFITQQNTYSIVGVVTLECVVSDGDLTIILENTHGREFMIWGVKTAHNETLDFVFPQSLMPESTARLTLSSVGGLGEVLVLLVDPETNASLVMACVP